MTRILSIRNRQRVRQVETRLLRRMTLHLLESEFRCTGFELCLHLVAKRKMALVNAAFLQHEGSTDVITFDYSEGGTAPRPAAARRAICGEIFICLDDAVAQARQFRTTWQLELARYVIHGLLHLAGYDDQKSQARRRMKREENRLLRGVRRQFAIGASAENQNRLRQAAPRALLLE